MPTPDSERSIDNIVLERSFDNESNRDLFLEGIVGKHLLITDKQSLNVFTRSLMKVENYKFIMFCSLNIEKKKRRGV